jgi:putative membrane protein
MKVITWILLIVIVLFGVSFSLLNSQDVVVNLYVLKHVLPLSLLLVITLGIGVLIGFITLGGAFLKLKRAYSQLKRRVSSSEEEIKNLRRLPLTEAP